MSSNKAPSSDFLTAKPADTTGKDTTSFGQNGVSQTSLFASSSGAKTGSSYMLETWAQAPASSEPWSPAKATYSSQP
ncbi:hypothetical protein N7491_010610 [Penicillium cf. griseofulvum]|uniref:Uncharacterized protein n=1 Tax=Penicillium cf. griseofulvum TaxID=2972120 RepID=A0A9W9T6X6_9EURO|nr:hypothetical protein N7472_000939 [Penicillium cf. griseofulvum]KAJ5422165.1 hypothetical protein N7491_010610 [Penicillium cf. griseofulvum]KAJ5428351.1 hypothetical protein N7445_009805 [Penicillium cf. griseofulvum]